MKQLLNHQQIQLLEDLGLSLRAAVDADAESILELIFKVLVEFNLELEPKGIDADLHAIESNYQKNGGILWVIESNHGEIVATSAVAMLIPGKHVELRKMYIHANFRKLGLGRLLMELTLAWCKQQKLRKISLETASVLKSAIELYQQFGFIEIPLKNNAVRCDRHFEMLLPLSPVNS